jgi:putative nucleotidyltransferase with HDIG domain
MQERQDDSASASRLAALIGGLSLATDLAVGLSMETAQRTCMVAVELGRELGVKGAELRDVYYTALLRFIGCTAYAHETAAQYGGDDIAFLRALTPVDTSKPAEMVSAAFRGTREAGIVRQTATVVNLMRDPKGGQKLSAAHCDLAVALAGRLGMSDRVVRALAQIYERFDGKGIPSGYRGEQIDLPARILHVALRAEVNRGLLGSEDAVETVQRRAGGELDPQIAEAFLRLAPDLLPRLEAPSVWDAFLAAEPPPFELMTPERTGQVALAFARYVDIKSPYTLGHSVGVAHIAEAAARHARLEEAHCESLRLAALLHDVGRVSVPNGIWDKPGPLNAIEWERVRLHPYYTERILSRSPLLVALGEIAALHHERLDGSGYYRGLAGSAISRPARILAAADAYHAMTEERPHRKAHTSDEAARLLSHEAQSGRLDREAVECVLAAAGQRGVGHLRGELPAALTGREAEVLCLLARGLSNKAIAAELIISPRTVQHHLEHIFDKTGIRTRAAAAVFAVVNGLIDK